MIKQPTILKVYFILHSAHICQKKKKDNNKHFVTPKYLAFLFWCKYTEDNHSSGFPIISLYISHDENSKWIAQ